MHKLWPALMGAAVLAGASGAQAAESIATTFERICMGAANIDQASAKARAEGFIVPPKALLPQLATVFRTNGGRMLWKPADNTVIVVLLSTMPNMKTTLYGKGVEGDVCGVVSSPAENGLGQTLEPIVGAGTPMSVDGAKIFLFTEEGGKRTRLPSGSKVEQAASLPGFGAVSIVGEVDGDFSGAVLMRPRKK